MPITAQSVSRAVVEKLNKLAAGLKADWGRSLPVQHFVVDNLLPEEIVDAAVAGFPGTGQMLFRNSIRERKRTSGEPEIWGEALRAVLHGLHAPAVLTAISEITGIPNLLGDPTFYASGISVMERGHFLNPHIDNSGHNTMVGYRRLNALFYVSRGWRAENGGNLELWSPKMKERVEITSSFNRLVVMNTNRKSLHSVNKVRTGQPRLCISNYYFTRESPEGRPYSHITSFRGRPDQFLRDLVLRAEGVLGSALTRLFPRNPNRS